MSEWRLENCTEESRFPCKVKPIQSIILNYLRENDAQKQHMNGNITELEVYFGNEVSGG